MDRCLCGCGGKKLNVIGFMLPHTNLAPESDAFITSGIVFNVFRFLEQLKVSLGLLLMQGVKSVFKFPLRVCFHSDFFLHNIMQRSQVKVFMSLWFNHLIYKAVHNPHQIFNRLSLQPCTNLWREKKNYKKKYIQKMHKCHFG